MMRKRLSPAILVAVLGLFLALGFLTGRSLLGPARLTEVAGMTVFDPATPLPEFRLRDQANQVFDRDRLRGRWSFVLFGYTNCPDICPTTLTVMRDVQRLAGGAARGVQYVFVSVDPARDNPATLKRYVAYFHPEFIGVTGDDSELQRLTRALGAYYDYDRGKTRGNYEVQHSAAVFLIDPEARLRALFAGPHEATRLAQGLATLRDD